MWKTLKKIWDWGYLVMMAWLMMRGPLPSVRETMVLTLLIAGGIGVLLAVFWQEIPRGRRVWPVWGIPLVMGIAYYWLPRIRHGVHL